MSRVQVLLLQVLLGMLVFGALGQSGEAAQINLLGLTATASDFVPGYEPSQAIDGSLATSWASYGCAPGSWWEVDLGSGYAVTGVRMVRRTGYPFDTMWTFHLELDGGQVRPTSGSYQYTPWEAESYTQVIDPPATTQHVRIVIDTMSYGCANIGFEEVQLWAGDTPAFVTPTPTPTVVLDPGEMDLRNKPCWASTYYDVNYRPANVLDFNMGTEWASNGQLDGATWEVDLGAVYSITGIWFHSDQSGLDDIKNFHFEFDEGQRRPVTGSFLLYPRGTNPHTVVIDPPVNSRRVRLVVDTMYYGASYVRMLELHVYQGTAPNFPTPTPTPTVVLDPVGQLDLRGLNCTASSYYDTGYRPSYATDFNFNTYWLSSPGQISGATWQVDLDGPHTLTAVRLFNYPSGVDNIRGFHLEFDGQRYPATGSYTYVPAGVEPFIVFLDPPVTTMHARIVVDSAYFGTSYVGMSEFQLWEGSTPTFPTPTPSPTVVLDPAGQMDLRGCNYSSSSIFNTGYLPGNAADFNFGTYWLSAPGQINGATWQVDLVGTHSITAMRIFNYPSGVDSIRDFHLEFDGQRCPATGSYTYVPEGGGSFEVFLDPPVTATFARLVIDSAYFGASYVGLSEFQLWETVVPLFPTPTPTPTVLMDPPGQMDLRGYTCSCSSFYQYPLYAKDFNFGTYWQSASQVAGATWEVQFGAPHTITGARLFNCPYTMNHIRDFHLECDGQRRPLSGSYTYLPDTLNPWVQVITPPVTTTSVQVVVDSAYFGAWFVGLTEVQLWEDVTPDFPPPTPSPTVVLDPPGQMDLRGKLCTSSSIYGSYDVYGPDNAVDFNYSTCWLSYGELAGAWWEVDLAGLHSITGIRVANYTEGVNHIRDFHLECDGQRRPLAGSYTFWPEGVGPFNQVVDPPVDTTHVRVVVDSCYYGASYMGLSEVQLWEGVTPEFPEPTPTPTVVLDPPGQMDLRGLACSASSYYGGYVVYQPVNAIDFDWNSCWLSYGETAGAWWEVELTGAHTLTAVRIGNYPYGPNHIRDFHLECDGQRRPLLGSYTYAPEGIDPFPQIISPPVTTTHVRVVMDSSYYAASYLGLPECQLWEDIVPVFPTPTVTPTAPMPLLPNQLDLRGCPCSCSSYYGGYDVYLPKSAKDFDFNSNWLSYLETAGAWWEVELGSSRTIDKVRVYDCPYDQWDVASYHLQFDNGQRRPTQGSYSYEPQGKEYDEREFDAVNTAHVRVVLDSSYGDYLGVSEIFLFEAPATPTPTASPTDTPSATPTDTPTYTPTNLPSATPTKTRDALGVGTEQWRGLP